MDYDFRNRAPPYDSHNPMYSQPPLSSSSSSTPHVSSPLYPRVGQQSSHPVIPRNFSLQQNPPPSSSSGLGIRVSMKPEFRITPPPQLLAQVGEVPRSTFQFDFEFERRVLAEAEKEKPNWSQLVQENAPPSKSPESTSMGSVSDPVVSKYIASGLSREAVPLAVASYGDNPTKVREFVNGYNLLREMGFSSNTAAEALLMYDNDTDKALAHLINNSA